MFFYLEIIIENESWNPRLLKIEMNRDISHAYKYLEGFINESNSISKMPQTLILSKLKPVLLVLVPVPRKTKLILKT